MKEKMNSCKITKAKMKPLYLFSTVICLAFSISCRPAASPVSISNKPISINDVRQPGVPSKPVEQMSWTKFDGSSQKLKDLEGKVVILDFWATYCPPYLAGMSHLSELQDQYGAENLQVIGLHVGGEEVRPKIPQFLNKLKINYTLGYPEDALVNYVFGKEDAIPQTAIFDRKGQLVRKIVGFDEKIKVTLDASVAQAIAR